MRSVGCSYLAAERHGCAFRSKKETVSGAMGEKFDAGMRLANIGLENHGQLAESGQQLGSGRGRCRGFRTIVEWISYLREVGNELVWAETIAENRASDREQDHRRTENTDLYRICLRPMTIHFHAFLPFTQMASACIISLRSSRSDHLVRSGERIDTALESGLSHAVEPARGLLVTGTGGKNK